MLFGGYGKISLIKFLFQFILPIRSFYPPERLLPNSSGKYTHFKKKKKAL